MSRAKFNGAMTSRRAPPQVARAARTVRARLREDLERLCADAGVSVRALAAAAGLDHSYVARVLRGEVRPSLETYVRLGVPLGADLSARLYANTGPALRDRHQARILEWLLEALHPRWRPHAEVAVGRPARGSIDVVLHDPRASIAVATEIESTLSRIEQMIRWSEQKAAALPSWSGWEALSGANGRDGVPGISRLLVVRRTRATREVGEVFARQLALAFPAHPDDALAALTGTAPWPGPALVWVHVDARGVRPARGRS